MGIIDSTHYRLKCGACGRVESLSVHQYGSSYSGGTWGTPKAEKFLLRNEEQFGEMVIKSASCDCGGEAEIEIS
ncbi:TPA: hypothetical protein ACXNQV_002592 [Stenotrophomonas maltophilia]